MANEKDQLDLFGNFNTQGNDLWGSASNDDPFGDSKNEDPFAFLPKEEPQKENNKVVSIKPTVDKTSSKKETKSSKKDEKAKTPAKPVAPKPVPSDQLVDATWTIAYAGHQKNPDHEMKLEQMRENIELDFPELSKERTKWIVDQERKLAVPVVSGAKNG